MIRIAIFASGSGSNAENIVRHFIENKTVQIHSIYTNNPEAGVIDRAKKLHIPCEVFTKKNFTETSDILLKLQAEKIDLIVLAGFLLLIPDNIIKQYNGKIINIHPSLLPLYGGKGYYGDRVHQTVISSGAVISGITIHHVNEKFDDGRIIFQAACYVSKSETTESLSKKIHTLEYSYYPVVIVKIIQNLFFNKPKVD